MRRHATVIALASALLASCVSGTGTGDLSPCRASELVGRFRGWIRDGSSLTGEIGVAGRGDVSCRFESPMRITFFDRAGRLLEIVTIAGNLQSGSEAVRIDPGTGDVPNGNRELPSGQGMFRFRWENWCVDAPELARARLTLTSGGDLDVAVELPGRGIVPACEDRAAVSRAVIFAASGAAGVTTTPGADVRPISVTAPPSAILGRTLRYRVTIASRSGAAVRLTTCPSYVVVLVTRSSEALKRTGTLDCAGRTRLDAGQRAEYDLAIDLPRDIPLGPYLLQWRLIDHPDDRIAAGVELLMSEPDIRERPVGLAVPTGCWFAAGPDERGPGVHAWLLDCGPLSAAPEAPVNAALLAQGWTQCGVAPGRGTYAKESVVTVLDVTRGAGLVELVQRPRAGDCGK